MLKRKVSLIARNEEVVVNFNLISNVLFGNEL